MKDSKWSKNNCHQQEHLKWSLGPTSTQGSSKLKVTHWRGGCLVIRIEVVLLKAEPSHRVCQSEKIH